MFRWGVDPEGYALQTDPPGKGGTLLGEVPPQTWIRRKTTRDLRYYEPREDYPDLHKIFAELANTPEEACSFVSKYGVLGASGSVGFNFDSIEGDQDLASFLEAQKRVKLVMGGLIEGKLNRPRSAAMFNNYARPSMTILIDGAKPNRPQTRIIPATLLSYIWLRVSEDIVGGVQWKKCKYEPCQNYFPVGKGEATSRREFCEDPTCRVYWNRQKKKGTV